MTGRIGGGLSFDGVDDKVVVPYAAALDLTSAVTLSTWVRLPADVTTSTTLVGRSGYALQFNGLGWPTLSLNLPSGLREVYSTTRLPLNRWVHLAGTYDGATMRLYIDGELAASGAASGAIVPSTADLEIGHGYTWLRGDLDEIRIYDRALTLAEILDDQTRAVDATLPLGVTARSPEPGTIGVRSAPLSATFGVAMSAASFSTSSVRLETGTGTPVSATISYTSATRTVTVTPSSPLAPLTDYRVTIVGGAEGVASATAATMASDQSWTFTTAATAVMGVWALDEGTGTVVADSSGNGNFGSVKGTASWTTGYVGQSFGFTGSNGIEIPDADTLHASTGLTMATWVKLTGAQSYKLLLAKQGYFDTFSYMLTLTPDQVLARLTTAAGDVTGGMTTVLPQETWTHIAATYDGSALRLYRDGTLVATHTASGTIVPSRLPLRIGSFEWSNQLTGVLDEVRLYDRALSASEIASLVSPNPPAVPTFSVGSGAYTSDQTVVITGDADATIRYTLNGADPTASDTLITTGGSVVIDRTRVLKARAFKAGNQPSAITTATYTMQVPTPTLTPPPGAYAATQNVSVAAVSGVSWHYTTDGSAPTAGVPIVALSDGGQVSVSEEQIVVTNTVGEVVSSSAWLHNYGVSVFGGQGVLHALASASSQTIEYEAPLLDEATVSFTGGINTVPAPLLWEVGAQTCRLPPLSPNRKGIIPGQQYRYRFVDTSGGPWSDPTRRGRRDLTTRSAA